MPLICASHSPLMLTGIEATDAGRQAEFFSRLEECAGMLAVYEPDLVVVFAPDHFNNSTDTISCQCPDSSRRARHLTKPFIQQE